MIIEFSGVLILNVTDLSLLVWLVDTRRYGKERLRLEGKAPRHSYSGRISISGYSSACIGRALWSVTWASLEALHCSLPRISLFVGTRIFRIAFRSMSSCLGSLVCYLYIYRSDGCLFAFSSLNARTRWLSLAWKFPARCIKTLLLLLCSARSTTQAISLVMWSLVRPILVPVLVLRKSIPDSPRCSVLFADTTADVMDGYLDDDWRCRISWWLEMSWRLSLC